MAFSYSFYISAKSHAVSNLGKVGQVGRHNLRAYEGKDYDRNLIETVVGSDDLLSDMEKVYHEEFDEALQRYNEGRRADRQIDDYMTHVSDSRSDVGVEIIIQVGDEEFWRDKSLFQRSEMSQVFEEQIEALQKHCPSFKIANATIHYDEKSPHMHVVGVPVAEGYQKGMERQCAKTKVFTKETLSELQDVMRAEVERSMEKLPSLFDEMELKTKEKGRNKDIPKESLSEFYQLQESIERSKGEVEFWNEQSDLYMEKAINSRDEADSLEQKSLQLRERIDSQEQKLATNSEALDQQADKLKKGRSEIAKVDSITSAMASEHDRKVVVKDMTIPEKRSFLGRIEEPEKEGLFVQGLSKEEFKGIVQHSRVGEALERSFENTVKRIDDEKQKASEQAQKVEEQAKAEAQRIVAEAQQRANLELQHAQMQIDQANRILADREKLQKEISSLNRDREELAPEVEKLRRAHRAYTEGWRDPQGNIHQGLNAIKEEYRDTSEKLSEARIELDKKLEGLSYDFSPEEVKQMLSDSLVKNLVQEASMQTCLQLEQKGLLKSSGSMAFIEVDRDRIIRPMKEQVENFIDKVKDHMKEMAEKVIQRTHHRSR